MTAEPLGPDPVEIVLLADIGEIARGGDEILHRAARGLERLLEIVHGERGLLAHGSRQVELLLAMRMAVVDGRGRDSREEEETAAPDEEGRRVRRSEEHTSELQSRVDLVC